MVHVGGRKGFGSQTEGFLCTSGLQGWTGMSHPGRPTAALLREQQETLVCSLDEPLKCGRRRPRVCFLFVWFDLILAFYGYEWILIQFCSNIRGSSTFTLSTVSMSAGCHSYLGQRTTEERSLTQPRAWPRYPTVVYVQTQRDGCFWGTLTPKRAPFCPLLLQVSGWGDFRWRQRHRWLWNSPC